MASTATGADTPTPAARNRKDRFSAGPTSHTPTDTYQPHSYNFPSPPTTRTKAPITLHSTLFNILKRALHILDHIFTYLRYIFLLTFILALTYAHFSNSFGPLSSSSTHFSQGHGITSTKSVTVTSTKTVWFSRDSDTQRSEGINAGPGARPVAAMKSVVRTTREREVFPTVGVVKNLSDVVDVVVEALPELQKFSVEEIVKTVQAVKSKVVDVAADAVEKGEKVVEALKTEVKAGKESVKNVLFETKSVVGKECKAKSVSSKNSLFLIPSSVVGGKLEWLS